MKQDNRISVGHIIVFIILFGISNGLINYAGFVFSGGIPVVFNIFSKVQVKESGYFKYITICNEKAKQEGVAHLGGEGSNGAFADPDTGTYFYALQGDRSKSRQQFVGSRLDYIDSWLTQGNYARGGANRLWGRISANNRNDLNAEIEDVHSDKWTHSETDPYWKNNIEFGQKTHEFDAEYWLEPKPIRSSYVTAGDDSMNYPSQKYDGVN